MKHLTAIALALLGASCMRNLRPDGIDPAGVAKGESAGRALLARAREVHGGDQAFASYSVMTVTLRDSWRGAARLVNPWPEKDVRVKMDIARAQARVRATFLDGDPKGTVWGLDGQTSWAVEPGEAIDRDPGDEVAFVLGAIQWLLELPFRIDEATVVFDAGPETIRGTTYDRVFASWSAEPSSDHDQFVVYLDKQTGRVAKVHFTVRKLSRIVESTVHYEDQRPEHGILLPHRWSQTDAPADDPAEWIRQLTVESFAFDVVPIADLGGR